MRISAWLLLLAVVLTACAPSAGGGATTPASAPPTGTPAPTPEASPPATPAPTMAPTPSPAPTPDAVELVAAGDIAGCSYETDSATAALVAAHPDATVATMGDNVYPHGSAQHYEDCYDPAWGAFLDRTRPAAGNHDVKEDDGEAFREHFAGRIGEGGRTWYSYELGDWHVVVLDSNCRKVGCDEGSEQHAWLLADLAASTATCTLAYWHHPRFSSGPHGNDRAVAPFWEALHAHGAELVLAGHDHVYERFAPQAPDASADPEGGIRQITAGTGGKTPYDLEERQPNSEHLVLGEHGILRLVLSAEGYAWSFLTVDGREADAGEDVCH